LTVTIQQQVDLVFELLAIRIGFVQLLDQLHDQSFQHRRIVGQ